VLVFVAIEQRRIIGRSVIAAVDVSREFSIWRSVPKAPSPAHYQRSSRPYAMEAMSHTMAMMRNIAPIGSMSNIWEPPRFDVRRARGGYGGRPGGCESLCSRRRTEALAGVLGDSVADAEPITAIVGQRGEFGGACVIVVSEFGDDGTEGPVVGEKLSFAGFEFADSVVGLVELIVQRAESGSCWRHGTSS
jgi:hypothetical protein